MKITEIDYRSDFTLCISLMDMLEKPLDLGSYDFIGVITSGANGTEYTFSRTSGVCVNCSVQDADTLICKLDNHGLQPGRLILTFTLVKPDTSYPDGNCKMVGEQRLDVKLVDGKCPIKHQTIYTGIVIPTVVSAPALPRIEVKVWQDRFVKGRDATNGGRTYLRLLNARPYINAGYKPILLRKCVRKQSYSKKGGDNRWTVLTKGWHIRGNQETLQLTAIQQPGSLDGNIEHLVAITGNTNYVNGEDYSMNAIDFVKPHSPYYPRGTEDGYKYVNDIVVSWGSRTMRIYDEDGSENGDPVISSPIRFRFGIAFQKDSNYEKTQLNLPMSEIVSNIATFSVFFDPRGDTEKQVATNADYYCFGY